MSITPESQKAALVVDKQQAVAAADLPPITTPPPPKVPESLTAGQEYICEICQTSFVRKDGEHVCPACKALGQKNRDWKRVMQFAVTVFSAVQASLLAWLYSVIEASQISAEARTLMAVLFSALVVGGISELSAIWGKASKEKDELISKLQQALDIANMKIQFATTQAAHAINFKVAEVTTAGKTGLQALKG